MATLLKLNEKEEEFITKWLVYGLEGNNNDNKRRWPRSSRMGQQFWHWDCKSGDA